MENVQAQLNDVQDALRDIKSSIETDRVFDVLEIVRDHVKDLSRGHDKIRDDIRELSRTVRSAQAAPAD